MKRRALVFQLPEIPQPGGWGRILDHIAFLLDTGWTVSLVSSDVQPDRLLLLQQRGVTIYKPVDSWINDSVRTGNYHLIIFGSWYLAEAQIPIIRQHAPHTVVIIEAGEVEFLRNARTALNTPPGTGAQGSLEGDYAGKDDTGDEHVCGG